MWFPPSIGHGWGGLPALEAIVVCYFEQVFRLHAVFRV
jgi:hypothetical protein